MTSYRNLLPGWPVEIVTWPLDLGPGWSIKTLRHSGILVLDWSVEIKRIAAYPKSLLFSLVIADVIFSVGQYSYSLVTSFRIFGGPVPTPGIFFLSLDWSF